MSAIYFDVPAPATTPLKALPLKYTAAEEIYGEREVDDNVRVVIFGQPFSYEWAILRDGRVAEHSDCGYGIADVALIHGLTAYWKPSTYAAPQDHPREIGGKSSPTDQRSSPAAAAPSASELAAIGAKVPAGNGYTERRDRAIWDAACSAMSASPAEALHLTAMLKYFSERGMTAWADVITALLRRIDSAAKP